MGEDGRRRKAGKKEHEQSVRRKGSIDLFDRSEGRKAKAEERRKRRK